MKWLSDRAVERLREAAEMPDLSGTRYRLVRELGRGGMGAVYLVEDTTLGREVALKVLATPSPSPDAAERLLREARIIARLEHPGIVPVHDAGTLADGRIFYVMKLVRGRRLDEHARGSASRSDLLRVFQRACEAVAFAHSRGVIHRDLKPENIMVGPFGEVLIMDWGVAKLREAAEPAASGAGPAHGAATAHGTVLGTAGYMAPEQASGRVDQVDERADVYALGAILQFLAGADRATLPRPLAAIGRKAMSTERGARYRGAQQLGEDVARFLDRLPVAAYRERVWERAARVVGRNRTLVLLVLAYLVMRALLLLFRGR